MKRCMRRTRGPVFERRNMKMVVLIIVTVLAGCFVSPAWSGDSQMRSTAVGSPGDDFGPDIYVPYEDLVQLIEPADKAMLMDRAEFEKLLAAAEASAEAADSLELGQVKHAEYSGTVSGEELVLTGKLQVVSMSENPVAVPLGFAQVGLTRVVLDDTPAQLGYDKTGRLTLIVSGKGGYQLEVAGTAKLKELSSGGMQFSLSLPAAVAGKMKLSAPGDLEMHATVPVSQPVYDRQADRTNVELTIGGQNRLTVVLLGNGRQEDEQAILLGESAATINLTRSHQVMSCLYTVQVLRRGVRELQFQMPSQWTITEVTCPSLVRWSVVAIENETGRGTKTLTVRLRSAKVGTTALHIKATAFRSGQTWHAPSVILVGAAFQRGYLMANTDEGLRVRAEKLTGARREDVATASVPDIVSTSTGRLYFHWGDNWSVDLELATVALRRSIKERQRLLVSPEQVTLTGDFEVTAIDRELFDISFALSGQVRQWQIRTVQVNGQREGFEYRIEDQPDKRLLRIELARPILPEKVAGVRIVLQHVPTNWHWPSDAAPRSITVPLIESQAETVSGHVSVSAVGDLDALPQQVPDGLEVVPVGRMTSLELSGEVQYAYSYKAAVKGRVQLEVSRRRPRIAAEAVGLITIRPEGVAGHWRIAHIISRASAKRLYLLADKVLGEKIKIASAGVPISSKSIVPADEKTLLLPPELTQRYNLWQLNLDRTSLGVVPIDIHYERPLTENKFMVPLVRPVCQAGPQNAAQAASAPHGRTSEHLAVQASEELALKINATGVKEIDAIDLPPLPVAASRVLAAYRLEPATTAAGSDAVVLLETAVHENYPVPSALAVLGRLTTYLDVRGGQRTEAIFRVANAGRQFLTFRLPGGAELWSLRVADRQAKPQRNTEGDYQVAIGRSREPVPVRIVFAYRPAQANLERLQLGGIEVPGVEMNKIHWNVIPPPGYRITTQQTKMQTRNLARPTPAYVQVYNFLTENLFGGIILAPALQRMSKSAKDVGLAWSEVESKPGITPSAWEKSAEGPAVAAGVRAEVFEGEAAEIEQAGKKMYAGTEITMAKPIAPPSKPSVRAFGLDVQVAAEGRFTLPVDLVPTPGAGPWAGFTGLGTAKLIVGLTPQPKEKAWWLVGFLLILAVGMAMALHKVRAKLTLFVIVLSAASLLAIWWPATTHFANGAFIAGICLLPLYLLIALIRWLWPRLRLSAPISPNAATVATLLFLVLVLGSSAQAKEVAPSAQRLTPQQDGMLLPPVIIPYEGDPTAAEESKKVLIPYSRFVKLWNRAHPEDPIDGLRPGTDISFADVRYRATVEGEQLKMLLTTDVKTYGKDWVVLALPIKGLAVTEASLDGKPAQWQGVPTSQKSQLEIRNSKTGMVLMLAGGTSGRLQLSAVARPKYRGRRGSASFSLPPLPAAVMTVVLPEQDLELEADNIVGTLTQRTVNGKVEWTVPLGMTRDITLRWLPRAGGGAADRTLSAASNHDVYAFHWALIGATKITYSFSAGEHDRFALYLPAGVTLTDLKGANIRDYRQVDEKTIEDRAFRVIEVRLHRAAKKQYDLTVRWLGELPTLGEPARLFLVRAGDVSRESGSVTVHAAGGMKLKVAKVSGGRRVNIESGRAELAAGAAQPVARYYWPYRPFSLSIQLSRLIVSPKASLDQLVRIGTDRVQLLVQATLEAERGRLFGANFILPKGYELLSAVGPDVENFYERSTTNGSFLNVKFSSAQRQTTMALVLVRSDAQLEDFQVPTITSVDSQRRPLPEQRGRLAVQVAASLDAQTLSSENLKSIAPRTLREWLDKKQIRRVQFAYRYEVPAPSLRLNISPQPTRIRVETFAALVVKTTAAAYTYRLRYNITGSPVDHLRLRMPTEYAPLVAVQSPAMRSVTQSDAGDGQTSWDVALVNEVTGIVDVTVNFALPIDASTKLLRIPRVETTAPEGYRGIVAVQNISRHEIGVRDRTNLGDLPVSEQRQLIPQQMRQSLQYVFHSFEDNWSLSLDLTPAKPAARIQAVVDLFALTTVIDRNGRCRYEARVALQNRSEQFLRVKLPAGLRLWSATVAGQPVKPARSADSPETEVLVPLVKTSPGGLPYEVYLYFADDGVTKLVEPLNGMTRLKPPAISIVGIPVMQTTWSLRLPAGYRYMRPGGNMSPVAGTVEMLSVNIGAKLEQLKRLDKAYRDVAGSFTQREQIAGQNWKYFNADIVTEIRQAQDYLEANRRDVSKEDYRRLKSKLGKQATIQDCLIIGNDAAVSRQVQSGESNMNTLLNFDASNPGVAEGAVNGFLQDKPEFVADNELRQIQRLNRELELSERRRQELAQSVDQLRAGDTVAVRTDWLALDIDIEGRARHDVYFDADGDKKAEMGRILEQLSEQSAAQIDMKQAKLKEQLSQIQDSRSQRWFREKGEKEPAFGARPLLKFKDGAPAERRAALESEHAARYRSGYGRGGYGGRKTDTGREQQPGVDMGYGMEAYTARPDISAIVPGPTDAAQIAPGEWAGNGVAQGEGIDTYGEPVLVEMGSVAGVVPVMQQYVARGTYSLPVSLPQGDIRLDFARPMGDAELSILAVPVTTLHTLYSSLAVLTVLIVLLGAIKVWPQAAKRPPISIKRAVIYVVLFVVLTLLLGLLGLLISLVIIGAGETYRARSARKSTAKAQS